MHDHESVALVMKRVKTKHLRCYLLAKAVDVNSDSSESLRNNKSRNPVTETAHPGPLTSDALDADGGSSMAAKWIPEDHMDGARSSALEMQHVQENCEVNCNIQCILFMVIGRGGLYCYPLLFC